MKRPAFQFYPSDWRKDLELQSCSIGARGLWHELMCVMHEANPYGHLYLNGQPMTEAQAANACRVGIGLFRKLFQELKNAGVPGIAENGAIYSRRMVRDEVTRAARAAGGEAGAEHGVKGAEHGKKGGRPRKEKPPLEPPPSSSSASSASTASADKQDLRSLSGAPPDGALSGAALAKAKAIRAAKQAAVRLIAHLNAKAGTKFPPNDTNVKLAAGRILYDLATEDDLRAVIDMKCAESQAGTFDRKYLRPATLFGKEKFSQYVGQIAIATTPAAPIMVKVLAERPDGSQELVTEYKANGSQPLDAARRALEQHAIRFRDFGAKNIVLDNGRTTARFGLDELLERA